MVDKPSVDFGAFEEETPKVPLKREPIRVPPAVTQQRVAPQQVTPTRPKTGGVNFDALDEQVPSGNLTPTLQKYSEVRKEASSMTRAEAIAFAGVMGVGDTYRGVKQINGLDIKDMKESDQKLRAIFANPEYGSEAKAAWIGGMVLDPAGWMIPLGKARTVGKLALYGAASGALSGLLGYVDSEDDEWQQRLINAGIGAGAGAVLVPAVSKGVEALTNTLTKTKAGSVPLAGVAPGRASDAPLDLVEPLDDLSTIIQKVPQKRTLMQPVKQMYQSVVGEPLKKFVFTNGGSLAFAAIGTTALNGILDDTEIDETSRTVALMSGFAALATTGKLTSKTALGQWTARQFIDNYGLPAEAVALRKAAGRQANNMAGSIMEIITEANKLDPLEQASFYKAIQGVGTATTPEMQVLVDSARNWIKDAGQQMVDLGLLDKDVYLKNIDSYINRSYTEHLNKTKEQKGLGERFVRKMRLIGTEVRTRGVVKEVSDARIQHYVSQGYEVWGKGNQKGTTKVRRQLTDPERLALGEIENGSFALARTSRLMINDISRAKYYNSMSQNFGVNLPKEFGDANSYVDAMGPDALDLLGKGYAPIKEMIKKGEKLVLLEGSTVKGTSLKQYGDLEGKWVPESIYRDLKATEAYTNFKNHPFFKPYREIQQYWKIGKTAWNPAVHMNNVMSNIVMFDFAEGSYKDLGWAFAEMLKGPEKSKYVQEAIKNGVFDADLFSQELNKQNRELLKDYLIFKGDTESDLLQNVTKMIKKMEGGQKGWLPAQLYQWEDKVFRLALYKGRVERGFDVQTSVNEARKWFIDYDINAPMINYMRETVTPFLAYSYRVIPLLTEAAIMRPWKFAKWAAFGYGLSYMGEDVSETDTAKERRMMANWQQKDIFGASIMPPTMLKLPLTVDGVPQYLNVERWIPGGDVFESKSSDNPLPAFLAPSGVGMALISGLFGIDSFRGEKLKGIIEDSTINNLKVKGEYLANQLLPNLPVPFGLTTPASKKLEDSIKGVNSPWTEPIPVWQAIIQLAGIKVTPVDLAKAEPRAAAEFVGKVNEIRKNVAENSAKDLAYGRITLEQHEKNIKNAVDMMQKLYRDFTEKKTGVRPPKNQGETQEVNPINKYNGGGKVYKDPETGISEGPKGVLKDGFLPSRMDVRKKLTEMGALGPIYPNLPRGVKNELIPLNVRALVSHVLGNDTPITEKHLVPEDLEKLKEVTIQQLMRGRNKLVDEDYTGTHPDKPGGYSSGLPFFELVKQSRSDPATRLASTLGEASIKKNAKGETIIYDIYNFANKGRAARKQEMRDKGYVKVIGESAARQGFYGLLSSAVTATMNVDDDTKGAPVEINLGVLNIPKPKGKVKGIPPVKPKGYAGGGTVSRREAALATGDTGPFDTPRETPKPLKDLKGFFEKELEPSYDSKGKKLERPELFPFQFDSKTGETRWVIPNSVRSAAKSLIQLFEGPYSGELKPEDALALAITSAPAGLLVPKGSVGMFAGSLSRTAKLGAKARAIHHEAEGLDGEEIRQATGWFRGKDKEWRYEIDDSQSSSKIREILEEFGAKSLKDFHYLNLDQVISHPKLFEAYPKLKDIQVKEMMDMVGQKPRGAFSSTNNTIYLNTAENTPEVMHSTLLHEIQHAIQGIEGFKGGTSREAMLNALKPPKESLAPFSRDDFNKAQTEASKRYNAAAGENEAVATQNRMDYTEENRKHLPPEWDMRAPLDEQILDYKRGGFIKKKRKTK